MRNQTPPVIPFTKAAYEHMQSEVVRLTQQRKDVLVRLQAAREMGDLSENGAYTYAKLELGNTNRELRRLRYLLDNGHVEAPTTSTEAIGFGSFVTIKNDKTTLSFTLVSTHESNLVEKKLSTESPIGKAVIGKKVSDEVTITTPNGSVTYTITAIS